MNGIKEILKSFANAINGFITAIRNERNIRVEISICLLVYWFGHLYGLTALETALIIFLTATVIAAELLNTSIEETHDGLNTGYNPHTKAAKDTAAAAVFLLSAASVIVGILVFSDIERLKIAFAKILTTAPIVFLCIYTVAAAIFIHKKRNIKERKQYTK